MKVSQKKIDDLNLTVSINIEKPDYEEAKKKKLNEYRRKAEIKGFRKGMAPMSLIERVHGPQALAETINTVVTEQLNKFIEDKKFQILGEPLPSEKEDKNDWDNPDKFSFSFDIALKPEVNVTVSADDKIPYYIVNATAKAVADYKKGLLRQFGQLGTGDKAKEDDFIIADLTAGEQKIEGSYIALRSITDEEIKKSFVGMKAGDSKDVDIVKTFTNEADRAAMFKVKKEELGTLPEIWNLTVKEVKTFVSAPLTQETFDQIFGEGNVKDEKEFDEKVKERLQGEYAQESDYRFMIDAKEYLINKAAITLPDAFMKRWILAANEGKFTKEEIEKEYDTFAKDFRWNMIRGTIMKAAKLKVTKDEVMKEARKMASYQFAMYGMQNVPEEHLNKFADQMLSDSQQADRIVEKVEDDITLAYIKQTATIESKKITLEKMRELTK
ncbi:MAG: trigger factor [Bacteroidales bacterium]|nr:trigger factor [Candidatus Cacconaster merdequi]